jgi:(S)-sulfolactate dehydrogenase
MAESGRAELDTQHQVIYDPDLHADAGRLHASLEKAAAVIVRNRTRIDPPLLEAAPQLVAVGRLGVGLENIDVEACTARGIAIHPAVGANAVAVAEYVIGSLLILARPVLQATASVLGGDWPRDTIRGTELSGKRLGLIGFGAIAREVATRARGLQMETTAHDPFIPEADQAWSLARRTALDELITTSDALSIHVPLTSETQHLLDESRLGSMRPGAFLINTSRGGIVDEVALARALRSGALGGAALDVFEREPLDAAGGATFGGLPNVILTPHVAGHTDEANARISRVVAAAVLKTLSEKA